MAQFDFSSMRREAQQVSNNLDTLDTPQPILNAGVQEEAFSHRIDSIEADIFLIQKSQSAQGFYQILTLFNSALFLVILFILIIKTFQKHN